MLCFYLAPALSSSLYTSFPPLTAIFVYGDTTAHSNSWLCQASFIDTSRPSFLPSYPPFKQAFSDFYDESSLWSSSHLLFPAAGVSSQVLLSPSLRPSLPRYVVDFENIVIHLDSWPSTYLHPRHNRPRFLTSSLIRSDVRRMSTWWGPCHSSTPNPDVFPAAPFLSTDNYRMAGSRMRDERRPYVYKAACFSE